MEKYKTLLPNPFEKVEEKKLPPTKKKPKKKGVKK